MQAMQLVLPLLALPWLARILGPHAFGMLMYLCLLPPLVALLMDWGLSLGGSREAAKLRGKHEELATLLGSVLSGKAILALVCIIFCLCLVPFLPYGVSYPGAYALAVGAGIARGMNPVWFFQGAGYGLPRMAAYDTTASLLSLGLVFYCIRQPDEWPLYLLFIALCKGLAYGIVLWHLVRQYRPRISFPAGIAMLRKTAAFFGSAFSLMFCYNGSQLVLGWFLPAAEMGIVAAVMKMIRALASLLAPVTQTLFPELCIWQRVAPARARSVLRLSLAFTFLGACCAAALAAAAAPWLMETAMGKNYQNAAPVLQIMLMAVPLMACNNVLAIQALAPLGQENAQLVVQSCCACLSLPIAAALGYWGGLHEAAFLPVCCESLMLAGFALAIWRRAPDAFS